MKDCNANSFWLSTHFFLEELLKEALTCIVANAGEDFLGKCSAHHLATIVGYHQTTFKEVQVILT